MIILRQNIYMHSSVGWMNMNKTGRKMSRLPSPSLRRVRLFRDRAALCAWLHVSFLFLNPTAEYLKEGRL